MPHGKRAIAAFAALLSLSLLAGPASIGAATAGSQPVESEPLSASEQAAVDEAAITMEQAVQAAEQQTGGTTIRTGVQDKDDKEFFYDVTIRKDGALKQVLVDMRTGAVVKIGDERQGESAEDGTASDEGNSEEKEGQEDNGGNDDDGGNG